MDNHNIFISYCHNDKALVLNILSILKRNGCLFWYDAHLNAASEFTEEIAKKLKSCPIFFAFFSAEYSNSDYCKDEWAYAKKQKRQIVVIRLDDSPLSDGMDMQSTRLQHLYYQNTADFYVQLLGIDGVSTAQHLDISLDHNRFIGTIRSLANWLVSLPQHWGVYDNSTNTQNANTCEGLLALKYIGYDREKSAFYHKVLNRLTANASEHGLISKSLHAETVVCTAMLLFLAALENPNTEIPEMAVFRQAAQHLWDTRNEDTGWGVYCKKTEDLYCCSVNTCWALIALSQYPAIANSYEYKTFCQQFFEMDSDGLFGFYIGGKPKLIATAMYLCLLHTLESQEQKKICKTFNYQKAVDFVFDRFVEKNVQTEKEELYGIDENCGGISKVPWNHITCGAALTALATAYRYGALSEVKWEKCLQHLELIIRENTVSLTSNKQYYIPEGIDPPRIGTFTFPTAYLLWGLQMVQNAISSKQVSFSTEESL